MKHPRALGATLCAAATLAMAGLFAAPASAVRANNCDNTWLDVRNYWLGQGAWYVLWRDYASAETCFAEAEGALLAYRASC